MPYKDPEKQREYLRRYNRRDRKEYLRKWRENNPEKTKEYGKQWCEANPDKVQKSSFMSRWRSKGVVGDLEAIYERWLNTTECDVCKVSLEGNKKCMDHDHQSGEFRHILCWRCNTCDFLMKVDRQAIKK